MPELLQSVADWCCYRKELAEVYYPRLREMGYQAVEMVPPERWPEVRAAGLKLLTMSSPGMQKGLNRVEHHEQLLAQLADVVRTAAANDIAAVIVFSGNREGQADEIGIANCVKGLKQLAGLAESSGVTLLLELLNSHEHKDYQCDHIDYAASVVRQVGSPRVRILYDIYHAHRMGEDVAKAMLAHLPLIGHLHVADSAGRTMPRAGQAIDYPALVRALVNAGYRGYWGQEFLPKGDVLQELREAHDLLNGAAK